MFSGGNWKTESYGVGYAVSERLDAGAEWTQACDGVGVLPLLRTVEGVIGPGHNSVVRGPDNRQLYCVYHRWDTEAGRRQLAIDPLEWIGDELTVFGPTNDARPAPNLPAISWPAGSSEVAAGAHAGWTTNAGHWSFEAATVRQNSPEGYCEIWRTGNLETGFVIECDVHVAEWTPHGTIGLYVTDSAGRRVRFSLTPEGRWLFRTGSEDRMNSAAGNGQRKSPFLGTAFIRLTASGQTLEFYPRQSAAPCRIPLHGPPKSLGLFTNNVSGDFSSFALTRGWHDTFERPEDNLADLGFETRDDGWAIVPMELRHETAAPPGIILKPAPPEPYEFVVNARLEKPEEGTYGFLPAAELDAPGPLVALRRGPDGYVLCLDRSGGSKPGDAPVLATLPSTFDAARYQQFSCIVDGSHMQIRWRGNPLCQTRLDRAGSRVGLYARGRAAFDMIRVTELTYGDRW
jgi:hypothetical protein